MKAHQGTCIKDTWIKPNGGRNEVGGGSLWGGAGGVEENGDNCT